MVASDLTIVSEARPGRPRPYCSFGRGRRRGWSVSSSAFRLAPRSRGQGEVSRRRRDSSPHRWLPRAQMMTMRTGLGKVYDVGSCRLCNKTKKESRLVKFTPTQWRESVLQLNDRILLEALTKKVRSRPAVRGQPDRTGTAMPGTTHH